MPKSIAFNALSILNRSGTGFYVRALVNWLTRNSVEGAEVTVILPQRQDPAVGFSPENIRFPDGVHTEWLSGRLVGQRGGRVIAEQFTVPRICSKLKADILHSPTGIAPLSLPCSSAVTVHDTAFRVFPNDFTLSHRMFVSTLLPRSARKADLMFTDSAWSRSEIHKYLGIPLEAMQVVPLGVAEEYFQDRRPEDLDRVRQRYRLPEDFLLYLGTIEPRKNLVSLVEALAHLSKERDDIRLVIAGRFGWKVRGLLKRIEQLGIANRVLFPGFVEHADLPILYRLAKVFVYPSKYEGFGLPVLEAMACGKAVIASDKTSIPEIAGNAAHLVDVENPEALARAVRELWEDPAQRQVLGVSAQERARVFPWRRTAETTFRFLAEM